MGKTFKAFKKKFKKKHGVSIDTLLKEFEENRLTLAEIIKKYNLPYSISGISWILNREKDHLRRKKVKLIKHCKYNSRLVSIGEEELTKAGFNPKKELLAEKEIKKGKVIFHIEEA